MKFYDIPKKVKYKLISLIALLLAVVFSLIALFSSGWFSMSSEKYADTDAKSIEEPPILYILDSDAEDITQLSLTELEIGETKQIVFCVSSVYPISYNATNYNNNMFNLELAYTNNLGADFSLYSANIVPEAGPNTLHYASQKFKYDYFEPSGQPLEFTDVSENGNKIAYTDNGYDLNGVQDLNESTYKKYTVSSDPGSQNYSLRFVQNGVQADPLYDTSKCRFFILNISWGSEILDKKALEKETDMIYILARGVQSV